MTLVTGHRSLGSRLALLLATVALLVAPRATLLAAPSPGPPPSLLLVTLDTTRADHLGCYGAEDARTPVLDALAARGTRWSQALSASPLTLPAHASLLTGRIPPEHGARDNGTSALSPGVPTLATILADRGYATAAFVASRVLDRRFGLARGFATYDDRMTAEEVGEYGYPERTAEAVTSAALDWLATRPADRPFFLWVHFYDAHAPYAPPAAWRGSSPLADYSGEIAYVDSQIGRLLAVLPENGRDVIVAAVADHGEALGEHGERTHGLFLYSETLQVPLILAGPGVPAATVVDEVVASRRLAPTLLALLAAGEAADELGSVLPGLPSLGPASDPQAVYSETRLPATAYGWSPLAALTEGRWRWIRAPRPELYDLAADPGESRNLHDLEGPRAERMAAQLAALESAALEGAAREGASSGPSPIDPGLAADLRALGYLSGGDPSGGSIDPKDGVALLAELDGAKELLATGASTRAVAVLTDLMERSPETIPFLTQLATAQRAAGEGEASLATLRRAVSLNPRLDFLHLHLAETLLSLGRVDEARGELELTLELDPRSARAWLGLGEIALRSGKPERERELLQAAVAAETDSAAIHARLGQVEAAAGRPEAAGDHFRIATELAPDWPTAWLLWGDQAERGGLAAEALERYARAATLAPSNPGILLRLGRVELATGAVAEGRRHLERAADLAPASAEGREARRLLGGS